jgi:uroporphyrinogen decarboxylase
MNHEILRPLKDTMSKRERVEAALNHQETDRVPVYDILVNDPLIEYFTGQVAPAGEEGLKVRGRAIAKSLDMTRMANVAPVEPGVYQHNWDGFEVKFQLDKWMLAGIVDKPFQDEKGAVDYILTAIENLKRQLEEFDVKKTAAAHREEFLKIQNYIGDDTVVLQRQSGTGLDTIRCALGIEMFSYVYADEAEVVSEYMSLATELEVRAIHAAADRKLSPCTLTYGDIACKGTLLHSPAFLRKEFFGRLKQLNDAWHEHDIKCLFHSDGDLMEIMPDLIEAGIDGLNPIETVAGMDLGETKKLYGDKLFLAGGIDMSQLLANGTADEVREVCRDAIATCDRGYFIGSTTELDDSCKLENALAMLEVAWGSY